MDTINRKNKKPKPDITIEYSVQFPEDRNCIPVIWEDYVEDDSHRLLAEIYLCYSEHSYKQARLRGFTTEELLAVVEYGDMYVKQDLCFFVARRRHLLPYFDKKTVDRLNNMVVVTNLRGNCIVTCYKSKDSSTHLKRKGKRLLSDGEYSLKKKRQH